VLASAPPSGKFPRLLKPQVTPLIFNIMLRTTNTVNASINAKEKTYLSKKSCGDSSSRKRKWFAQDSCVAIRNPERHMRKASHWASKEQ